MLSSFNWDFFSAFAARLQPTVSFELFFSVFLAHFHECAWLCLTFTHPGELVERVLSSLFALQFFFLFKPETYVGGGCGGGAGDVAAATKLLVVAGWLRCQRGICPFGGPRLVKRQSAF